MPVPEVVVNYEKIYGLLKIQIFCDSKITGLLTQANFHLFGAKSILKEEIKNNRIIKML